MTSNRGRPAAARVMSLRAVSAALMFVSMPASGARAAADVTPVLRIRDPRAGGLIALAQGELLAWNSNAQIQVRSRAGSWGPIGRIPSMAIERATADPEGALLFGMEAKGIGQAAAAFGFLVDARGEVTERWNFGDLPVASLTSAAGSRWAATSIGIVELLPGSKVTKPVPPRNTTLLLKRDDRASVYCADANLTEAHSAPAHCYAVGMVGWSADGDWTHEPFVCGDLMIEASQAHVSVRRLADGKVVSRRGVDSNAAIACGGPAELLIGSKGVTGLSLPDLRRVWHQAVRAGRVTAVARAPDGVVVFTDRAGPVTLAAGGQSGPTTGHRATTGGSG